MSACEAQVGSARVPSRQSGSGATVTSLILLAGLGTLVSTPAFAEDPAEAKKLDLTFERPGEPDTWIRPNARIDTVWFAGFDAWGGRTAANIGENTNGWMELGVVPGVDAQVSLGDYGRLTGRLSGVFTTTQLGLDFAGSNIGFNSAGEPRTEQVKDFTLEDFFVRWTSGQLFSSLGEDALDLSVGSQVYQVGPDDLGSGFIFYNAGSDGGKRGGYWLGLRNAFQMTGMARLRTGNWFAEAVFLRSDETEGDHSNILGGNLSYDFASLTGLPAFKLGLGYWNIVNADDERRDGLNVVNFRVDLKPFETVVPGLGFTGEMVKEKNGKRNDSWGGWGELGYDFAANEVMWSPYVSYRMAYFSGDDDGSDEDNAFDPLFYGFSDWNYWYIGEISGEWITGNSNFWASVVRLRANPLKDVTTQVFWIYQRLNERQSQLAAPGGRPVDPRVLNITDKDLSHEVDFIVDWSVNDYLTTSFVAAFLVPLDGAEQFFGDDDVWGQFMVYASVKF